MATAPAAEAKAGLRLAGWAGVKAAAVVELPRAAERVAEAAARQAGLTTCSILFCLPFVKKTLFSLEGKLMTLRRRDTIFFRSSQQLHFFRSQELDY